MINVQTKTNVMFSSKTSEWETPQSFFDKLDSEFNFTLDPCCTDFNAKCKNHYTKEHDGLSKCWDSEVVYMNPPYGREIYPWIEKASKANTTVVCLLPARTDTQWFHKFIYNKAEIRFIKGRLKFGGCQNSAPFPSMVVVFRNKGDL